MLFSPDVALTAKESLRFNIGDIPSSFLLDIDDPQLAQRIDTNIKVFLAYASQHWDHHLDQTDQKNGEDLGNYITDFLQIRVLFWIEAMNLLRSSGRCSTMLQLARGWVLKVRIFSAETIISKACHSEHEWGIRACCQHC